MSAHLLHDVTHLSSIKHYTLYIVHCITSETSRSRAEPKNYDHTRAISLIYLYNVHYKNRECDSRNIYTLCGTECWKFQSKKGGEGYIYIGKYPENNMNHNGEGGGFKTSWNHPWEGLLVRSDSGKRIENEYLIQLIAIKLSESNQTEIYLPPTKSFGGGAVYLENWCWDLWSCIQVKELINKPSLTIFTWKKI